MAKCKIAHCNHFASNSSAITIGTVAMLRKLVKTEQEKELLDVIENNALRSSRAVKQAAEALETGDDSEIIDY